MEIEQVERQGLEASGDVSESAAALSRLLADRYSCRAYRPDPVSRETIGRMLSIAQNSASWCNSQPWEVIVTEGQGTERFRQKLYAAALADSQASGQPEMRPEIDFPTAYTGVFKARQREVGWQLYDSVGVKYGDREASGKQALENYRLFGAPHALIITSERDLGAYGAIDCGLYVGSLLLAAQALGLGMIPQAAIAGYASVLREHFNLPGNRIVVLGCSFGYPVEHHPANSFRSRRAKIEEVVTWATQ